MVYLARFYQLTALRSKLLKKFNGTKKQNGFSLVEILIVVAIIGLLVGLVGPSALRQFQSSKTKTAEIQIEQIKSALDLFLLDVGRYPNETEGLEVLISNDQAILGWNGPYLKDGKLPLDPWGRKYNIQFGPNSVIQLESLGADGVPGGEGNDRDIIS